MQPLLHGGTGSQSEAIEQPRVRPDRYEAGTPNTVGIAGLGAGVKHVLDATPASIYKHEWNLTQLIMEGLSSIKGIRLLGPDIGQPRSGLVSFTIEGYDSAQLAFRLDRNYGIAVRSGFTVLHLHMSQQVQQLPELLEQALDTILPIESR